MIIKSKDLIVSRYNENIEWIFQLQGVFRKTHVYNKGVPLEHIINEKKLPNVGREAHTYLQHIITNYDNLADINFFCQANPFDHASNAIEFLKTTEINKFENFNNDNILQDGYDKNYIHYKQHGNQIKNLKDFCVQYDIMNTEDTIFFSPGAQFVVPASIIRSRPIEFYKHLIKSVDYDISPIESYLLERVWHKILQ